MKMNLRMIIIAVFLVTAPLVMLAQPPHPNGGSIPGPGNTPVGGTTGAPISDGVALLLSLGAAYGAGKVYQMRKTSSLAE
jgi:hypothetical protein